MRKYKRVNYMDQLKNNIVYNEAKHCVFCSIYTFGKPYLKKISPEYRDEIKTIPMTLMQYRWDNQLGFPGGKVDIEDYPNGIFTKITGINTLKKALVRELKEEINMTNINPNKLRLMSTYYSEINNVYVHNFNYYVKYDEYVNIYKNSINANNIFIENCGSVNVHLIDYYKKDYYNLIHNKFAATAGEEVLDLLEFVNNKMEYQSIKNNKRIS